MRGNHPGLIPISEKLTKKQQRNMNMLESDRNGNEALLSAANSFSRNVNDTELIMTSRIWHMDLRIASSFGIKTADRVWQTSLTEELKISVSSARNATDRCGI